jgi:hypothetical protein
VACAALADGARWQAAGHVPGAGCARRRL